MIAVHVAPLSVVKAGPAPRVIQTQVAPSEEIAMSPPLGPLGPLPPPPPGPPAEGRVAGCVAGGCQVLPLSSE